MTVESKLHREHDALTTLTNGRYAWCADVDKILGFNDMASSPHELLDSALAACTALTLKLYFRRRGLAVTDLRVEIDRQERKNAEGRVHDDLSRTLRIAGALDEADRARLLEIANKCPIHRVLEGEITVATALA